MLIKPSLITMKQCFTPKNVLYIALCAFNLFSTTVHAAPINTSNKVITNEQLIYTPQEMLSFNIKSYLNKNAPHLSEFSEVISHWSGYSSISPKIIISLIENQTGLVTKTKASKTALLKPLSTLSNKTGFSEQVKDIALQLSKLYYQQQKKNPQDLLKQFLDSKKNGSLKAYKQQDINTTYFRLFPLAKKKKVIQNKLNNNLGALAPDDLFQLPYPTGTWWGHGGSHTYTGSDSNGSPYSSLDFFSGKVEVWGSDTSNNWVVASNNGRVIKHSSCFVEVIHPSNWSTTYYHLDNIQVSHQQQVTQNTYLANYASNKAQALCNGGHSTGPHLHFSLKYNGSFTSLNGIKLSGYAVHTGRYSYDSDHDFFWLEDSDGKKHFAFYYLYNSGIRRESSSINILPSLMMLLLEES